MPYLDGKKYYVIGSKLDVEEDLWHEFKGHRNLRENEIPDYAKVPNYRTRQRLSKAFSSFLNNGMGGTTYIGVCNDGHVSGFPLHKFQLDHLLLNIHNLMASYTPPVKKSRYRVDIIPALNAEYDEDEIRQTLNFEFKLDTPELLKYYEKPHIFDGDFSNCWCYKIQLARFISQRILSRWYVIEVTILGWDTKVDDLTNDQVSMFPLHLDEEMKLNIREHATTLNLLRSEEIVNYYNSKHEELVEKKIENFMKENKKRLLANEL